MASLDDFISDLPSQPSRAIVMFADRVNKTIIGKNLQSKKPEEYDAIATFATKFCSRYKIPVNLAAKSASISSFEYMKQVIAIITNNRSNILAQSLDSEVEGLILQYDSSSSESFGVARLNAEEKKSIHQHIQRIRTIIQQSSLPDRKKNALYERLTLLTKEVDQHGTVTDRFFSFVADLGFVLGDFGKNAKPLLDEARGMIKALSRARARQEGISLPPGDEPLRLPSPEEE